MQQATTTTDRPEFNVALNGYRGLCALLVFVFHIGSAGILLWPAGSLAEDAVTYLWSSLTYGVEMFFMISGFVIFGSLLRHRSMVAFLKDRFTRIFSAWAPALIAVTAVCVTLDMPPFTGMSPLGVFVLFVGNFFLLPPVAPFPMIHQVSWSLTYEWAFYFTAAAGALLYRRNRSQHALMILWGLLAALFICLFPRALFFLTGVIVFKYRDWFARQVRWLQFPVLSLLLFLIAWRATDAMKAHLNDTMFDFIADGRWVSMLIAFAASLHMFASVTLSASGQTAFLRERTFQFLGNISYSFYLWHTLAMAAVKRLVIPHIVPEHGVAVGIAVFTLGSLAISLPVSWLSWRLFEVRLARLIRKAFAPRDGLRGTVRAT